MDDHLFSSRTPLGCQVFLAPGDDGRFLESVAAKHSGARCDGRSGSATTEFHFPNLAKLRAFCKEVGGDDEDQTSEALCARMTELRNSGDQPRDCPWIVVYKEDSRVQHQCFSTEEEALKFVVDTPCGTLCLASTQRRGQRFFAACSESEDKEQKTVRFDPLMCQGCSVL